MSKCELCGQETGVKMKLFCRECLSSPKREGNFLARINIIKNILRRRISLQKNGKK